MVKSQEPTMLSVIGHSRDVLLHAAENGNDNLPWLRIQSKGCDTRMLNDEMIMKATS